VSITDDGPADANPGDNLDTEITPVVYPDLQVKKSDGGVEIGAGGTITYTLSFTNTGTVDATGVLLTETVPADTSFNAAASTPGWACASSGQAGDSCTLSIGAVAGNGGGGQLNFGVVVDKPIAAFVTQIANTVEITDDGPTDANPGDNTHTDTTPVDAAPDLTVTKDDGVEVAPPGSTIVYTIEYANIGDRISASTIISETVPMYTTWDANNSSAGWVCNPVSGAAGTNCTINVGNLGDTPGSTTFAVTVDSTLPAGVTETTNNVDIYGISVEEDANPNDNSFSLTTTLNEAPEVTIVLDTPTIQHSDVVSATITATDSGSIDLTIATSWSKTGCEPEVPSSVGLPDGLEIVPADTDACESASGGGVECARRLQGQMLEPEGVITIEVEVSDGELETTEPMTITVEPEEVLVEFAPENPLAVEVVEPGGFSQPFTLTTVISEFEGLADSLARAGDVDNAVVSMVLVPVGPGSNVYPVATCDETITAGTEDPGSPFDYDILTVVCAFNEAPVNTYNVVVVVDPNEGNCAHYLGLGEDVVTVFDPSLGFTTGGGWFYWPGTEDPGSGYPGDRTHAGFNVKVEKKGKKGKDTTKGSLLVIRHLPDGSIVRLKSNAMDGLAVGEDRDVFGNIYGWASFNGKATFQAVGWPEPIGNHEFVAYVEDNDEPGAGADRFWVQVVKDGVVNDDLSLPEPATINAETLGGGNFVVPHSPGGKGDGGGGGNRVQNLELVGRGSRILPGATTDVWALGDYAYVGTFNFPCSDGTGQDGSGVRIWDVTDPTAPVEIDPIPSPAGSRANDVKVASMGSGDILVHSNERCAIGGPGGFEVWDVDDPENPMPLAHVGPINELNQITASWFGGDVGVHNLWLFTQGNQDYVAVVAESVFDNFRIYDITDPANPVFVSAWGAEEIFDPGVGEVFTDTVRVQDAVDWLDDGFGNSRNRFLHDVTVSADGNSAHLSNWDAGFVLLDISDPANPQLVSVALDPVTGSPDGEVNSHAGWPSEDGSVVVETEEDFSIYTTVLTIDTGPSAGDYPAAEGRFTESLLGSPMSGPTVYVGLACPSDTVPPAGSGQIALIQRGSCDFDEKASQVIAAGYSGMVVFNHSAGGEALVNMVGDPRSIQGVFVGRSTGLAIAGVADESGLSVGAPGETVTAKTVPDAWGGVRIWDYSDPANPVLASNFFTECSADPVGPSCEEGRVYSVHNVVVETDTDGQTRAFISWYADGVRVINVSDPYNPVEEFSFVESGSAFEAQNGGPQDVWGIYKQADLIYASDRNGGLYILQLPKGKGNK
jgi:uncharacterized repeat protein (TIGR01451 family)